MISFISDLFRMLHQTFWQTLLPYIGSSHFSLYHSLHRYFLKFLKKVNKKFSYFRIYLVQEIFVKKCYQKLTLRMITLTLMLSRMISKINFSGPKKCPLLTLSCSFLFSVLKKEKRQKFMQSGLNFQTCSISHFQRFYQNILF